MLKNLRRLIHGNGSMLSNGGADLLLNLEELRARLARMDDTELLRFGRATKQMMAPEARVGSATESHGVQLHEAGEEWKRRHPIPAVFADSF
jgi:hypothetical protein